MFKNLVFIKKASVVLYPKCYNRDSYDEKTIYTRKKEGVMSYLTVDNCHALYKIADIHNVSQRRWIKRKQKKSLAELQQFKKKTLISHAHSLILNPEKPKLYFQIQQQLQLKALLPFVMATNYDYVLNLKNLKTGFGKLTKIKNHNFYVLKPIKGGFKAYTAGTLGFLPKGQIKKFFRWWRKKNGRTATPKALHANNLILPKPLNLAPFKNFKIRVDYSASCKKKNYAPAKKKQARLRMRSKIKFVFTFFKYIPWWEIREAKRQIKQKEWEIREAKRQAKKQATPLISSVN